MITKEQIQEKIKQLTAEREHVATEANQRLAAYNGAIQALEQLLEETAVQPANGVIDEEMAQVLHE